MPDEHVTETKQRDSIFLKERFMAAVCIFVVAAGLVSVGLSIRERDSFAVFQGLVKLVTAAAMYLAFRFFKWDVAKGLMGGVLFCLMYQEAHLVMDRLWGEQEFEVSRVAGVQGSLYRAAAGMSFLMTVIITVSHFFINYTSHGNLKDVIFNRIAVIFKFAVYLLLFASNNMLGFPSAILLKNAVQYLSDIALLLLLVCLESQFDSFNAIRQELKKDKRERRKKQ